MAILPDTFLPPPPYLSKVPGIRAQENIPDPTAYFKQFLPGTVFTWYCLEMDITTGDCFGLVEGMDRELGYYNQNELRSLRSPFGLTVEFDRFFVPCPLSQIRH